ncbi:MAG: hypothetical protein ABJC19_07785 [Gemmatimonadota bacterium]
MLALAFALTLSLAHADRMPPASPALQVRIDADRHQVVLTITDIDIPAPPAGAHHAESHAMGGELPLLRFTWPVTGWARGAALRLTAADGTALPRNAVHHLNVVNFARRQLFYPIAERLLAMGQETEDIRLPASVGVPVSEAMSMGVVGAFHNPGHAALRGLTLEVRIDYSPANMVPRPVSVLPAYLDVRDPVGHDVDFDLPAGPSRWVADFAMPISGRIIGAGGHLHNYGTGIQLLDVTDGGSRSVLALGTTLDRDGHIARVERALPGIRGKGIKLEAGRRYRLVGEYRNGSGAAVVGGAMVHLILLFAPDVAEMWPAVAASDANFTRDTRRLEEMGGAAAMRGMPR